MISYFISLLLSLSIKVTRLKKNKLQNTRQQPFYLKIIDDFSKVWFSMERKVSLAPISGGCLGGSLTGVLGSENPSSSSMVIGFSTDHSFQKRRNSQMAEPHLFSVMGTCVI